MDLQSNRPEYHDTLARLEAAQLPNLLKLYKSIYSRNQQADIQLIELGSSSISGEMAACCDAIIEHMRSQHGVDQHGSWLNQVWRHIDGSAAFYFGSSVVSHDTGKRIVITPDMYIEFLSFGIGNLPDHTRKAFDELCGGFLEIERAIDAKQFKSLRFNDKKGHLDA